MIFEAGTHLSKDCQLLCFRPKSGGWVGKTPMNAFSLARKERAGFRCLVTDGYHDVERSREKFAQMLRALVTDIDIPLGHHANSERIDPRGCRSRALHLDLPFG